VEVLVRERKAGVFVFLLKIKRYKDKRIKRYMYL
jgi:hypothetical protein